MTSGAFRTIVWSLHIISVPVPDCLCYVCKVFIHCVIIGFDMYHAGSEVHEN